LILRGRLDRDAARQLVDAALSRAPASLGPRRTTSTHEFYRYPARFRPEIASALISAFTQPGGLVIDPFVGGGTTLVESRLASRVAVGNDVNQLATFVARVKSTPYPNPTLNAITTWADAVSQHINLQMVEGPDDQWVSDGYLRNVDGPALWRLRKFISLARSAADTLTTEAAREFVRCAILRTAQWALDMREALPSVPDFRDALHGNLLGMVDAARSYSRATRLADRQVELLHSRRTMIVTGRAQDLPLNRRVGYYGAPQLVLTSPPYPGVYVNYHRWKVQGRRETPVPYWIAKQLDGKGLSYYTMSARAQKHLANYFGELKAAFSAISSLCDRNTIIAQVVGFSDRETQLNRYLETMKIAGLEEIVFDECATADDGRLWRDVPGRRWWTKRGDAEATAREVVLFHRTR
jgi:hypothetical protein